MVYGMAIARDLGLLDGYTVYYLGNIEEWCDGVGCAAFVEWQGVRPDFVVIGEPTKMNVYRGHKGRLELEVVCKGKSAHAASNHLGDNAIYKVLPLIEGVSKLEPELGDDPFLGIEFGAQIYIHEFDRFRWTIDYAVLFAGDAFAVSVPGGERLSPGVAQSVQMFLGMEF